MLIKDSSKYTWFGKEITETQYNEILAMLHNIPTAPEGFAYRLTEELEWELYELPAEEVEAAYDV